MVEIVTYILQVHCEDAQLCCAAGWFKRPVKACALVPLLRVDHSVTQITWTQVTKALKDGCAQGKKLKQRDKRVKPQALHPEQLPEPPAGSVDIPTARPKPSKVCLDNLAATVASCWPV